MIAKAQHPSDESESAFYPIKAATFSSPKSPHFVFSSLSNSLQLLR